MAFNVYRLLTLTGDARELIDTEVQTITTLSDDYVQFDASNLFGTGSTFIKNRIIWEISDGTVYRDFAPTHNFKYAGQYTVTLTLFDSSFSTQKRTRTINVVNFIEDSVKFEKIDTTFSSAETTYTIVEVKEGRLSPKITTTRKNSWQNHLTDTFKLYASGSRSNFFSQKDYLKNKVAHLIPTVRFLTEDPLRPGRHIQIDEVKTTSTPIYAKKVVQYGKITYIECENTAGAVVAGYTGSASFYFVDDTVTLPSTPTFDDIRLIYAVLDASKITHNADDKVGIDKKDYSTEQVETTSLSLEVEYIVTPLTIDSFLVTSNGITDDELEKTSFNINPVQWQDVEIPFVVNAASTANGISTSINRKNSPFVLVDSLSSINLSDPAYASKNVLELHAMVLDNSEWTKSNDATIVYDASYDDLLPYSNSFYSGILTLSTSHVGSLDNQVVMLSGTMCTVPDILYTYPRFLFLTSPIKNTLYRYKKVVTDNPDEAVFGSIQITNASLSSTTGSFGVAYDFLNCKVWVTNPDDDTLKCYDSNSGKPLLDIVLSTLLPGEETPICPSHIVLNQDGNPVIALTELGKVATYDVALSTFSEVLSSPITQYFDDRLSSNYALSSLGQAGEFSNVVSDIQEFEKKIYVLNYHMHQPDVISSSRSHIWSSDGETYSADGRSISTFKLSFDGKSIVVAAKMTNKSIGEIEDDYIDIGEQAFLAYETSSALEEETYELILLDSTLSEIGTSRTYIDRVGNIAFDKYNRVWVTHNTGRISVFEIVDSRLQKIITMEVGALGDRYIHAFNGMATDLNNMWVVDNFAKRVHAIPLDLPAATPGYIYPINTTTTAGYFTIASGSNEILGYDDFAGYEYINKYNLGVLTETGARTFVNGQSAKFNVLPQDFAQNVLKINEDFNALDSFKANTFQDFIHDSQNLQEFLSAAYGDVDRGTKEIGVKIYEKIANFVMNNSDIDTCNIKSIYAFASQIGVTVRERDYSYPYELLRLMDIMSIKFTKLAPLTNKFKEDFNSVLNPGINVGAKLDFDSYVISSGVPIIAYEKFSEKMTLQDNYVNCVRNNVSTIPLSTWNENWGWNMHLPSDATASDVKKFYDFFEYVENDTNLQSNLAAPILKDVINYDYSSAQMLTSYSSWTKDNGIMEIMLSKNLIDEIIL